ncbi:MAG: A24 family peptidase [Chloroflexi bacterium]|nr:A24 family peptidase [Chloroflexota bacterium]
MVVEADVLLKTGMVTVLAVGAVFDLRTRRIPNLLTLGGALAGLAANAALHQVSGVTWSLEGWLAGIGLLLIPFLLRAIGGGDVKLLAAVGAWGGPGDAFNTLVFGAIVGALLALLVLLVRGDVARMASGLVNRIASSAVWSLAVVWPPVMRLVPSEFVVGSVVRGGAASSASWRRVRLPYGPALAVGGVLALLIR